MKVRLYTNDGKENGTLDVADAAFGGRMNGPLVHQVVTSLLANQRQGTAKTKGRAEMSGGGTKPYKQKGTGRARAGSNTSPVWRRGGKAFGPDPRDYYGTIPRNMRRTALRAALGARAKEEKIVVIEQLSCTSPKTKVVAGLLKAMQLQDKRNLLVLGQHDRNVYLSGRNIRNLVVKPYSDINAYDVLNSDTVIFGSPEAVKKLEEAVTP